MGKAVGIDLGTTNSVVAVMEGGEPTVISTAEGGRLVPSVVGFKKNGERLVGITAKRQVVVNSENTVYSAKRFIGRRFDEVSEEIKLVPFKVKPDKNGMVTFHIPAVNKDFTPVEIGAMVLGKLKADAEAYLGEPVTDAVITVPAYFNDAQRTATKQAGEVAGLNVLRIINEPTAASLAYGLDKKKNETVLVFDLGGGTFDVSILDVGEGVFEVKATSGDTHLGGDDFDDRIVQYVVKEFKKDTGVDLMKQPDALQRVREAAEKAKIELSSQVTTNINLPYITAVDNQPKHLDITITRAQFEGLCTDLLERVKKPFHQALEDAKLKPQDIDEVLLVGGSTRMPMVQELVKTLCGKEPNRGVNPDEVVAVGAAIQAGVLAGEVKGIVLLDVTPLSLGVETLGDVMDVLIERNTTIPTKKQRTYTTAKDGQTEVEIHILQGERSRASANKSLGKFHLTGIPPAPARVPQIEVTFDIDANGILNVSARDLATNRQQAITITGSGSLSKEEIERMIAEAESLKEQDREFRERAETFNKADQLCYSVEKTLADLGDQLSEADKATVNDLVASLRKAVSEQKLEEVNRLHNELEQEFYKLSKQVYERAGSATQQAAPSAEEERVGAATGAQGSDSDEDVIDAEFKAE
ncbi:MAG: chaperone protein DnaK [Fimbriimonadales bacterium]